MTMGKADFSHAAVARSLSGPLLACYSGSEAAPCINRYRAATEATEYSAPAMRNRAMRGNPMWKSEGEY
ncbi:MAG TPA: hypothetical protein DEA96_18590 [Leptospiraceae bacterium]|nr:hypothetical protein [Spirochaetaceae bacterium]HBS06986.1 hypothetical protein [Leptospiraceae bacterium]